MNIDLLNNDMKDRLDTLVKIVQEMQAQLNFLSVEVTDLQKKVEALEIGK